MMATTATATRTAADLILPIIPDNPSLSWAAMAISTFMWLDVGTLIGEYHRALDEKWNTDSSDYRKLRRARKGINRAAFQVVVVMLCIICSSAYGVWYLTANQDWRMTVVLEGISRLEAACFFMFISIKIPRWIGVYYSPARERQIQHVGKGIRVLRFHVRYSLVEYFFCVYCFLLPFCGRPTSILFGFLIGILVEATISFSVKRPARQQAIIALFMAFLFAAVSSVLFADGCHYIQIVWGTGPWRNEWGLGLVSFFSWLSVVLLLHMKWWHETEKRLASHRRYSIHDREERNAISLVFSHVFGSMVVREAQQLAPLKLEQIEDSDKVENEQELNDTTWSLLRTRWSTPSDLVFIPKLDLYLIYVVSLASLFLVVINIGATAQMDVVRAHFHTVHETLYGTMEEGPVCAFDKLNGTIATFDSRDAAHAAGYKVAHCGACGACSDWHNLRLQYTTRDYLAKESARCARKSLVGGSDAVLGCLGLEPIGFSGRCAECWTEDIMCSRRHCAFIFLQSNMINTVTNFQVGPDTITSATCEEAMCELEFVPCSGANRRRMAIQSTIKRPNSQLCGIVDVDWAQVFQDGSNISPPSDDESSKEEL